MRCTCEVRLKGKMLLFFQGLVRLFFGVEARSLPCCLQTGPERASPKFFKHFFPVKGDCFCFISSQIICLPASLSHNKVCVLKCSCFGDGFGSCLTTYGSSFLSVLPTLISVHFRLQEEVFEAKCYCQRWGVSWMNAPSNQ